MSEWQPIETAPKDGSLILFCVYLTNWDEYSYDLGLWNEGEWECEFDLNEYRKVVYWMPLPEPPKPPNIGMVKDKT